MRAEAKKARIVAALLFVFLLLVGNAQAAVADTVEFGMSKSSVRAGEAVAISEIDPCPVPAGPDHWGNNVEIKFTDALGVESGWNTTFDENGHWGWTVYMTPPHMRVLDYDPVLYSSEASPGPGTVEVKCTEWDASTLSTVTTLEYPSKTLAINGPSAGVKVIPSTLKAGKSGRIESVVPCPSGTGVVDVSLSNSPSMTYEDFTVNPDGSGAWSVDFTVPSTFPDGYALVEAFCRPPGNHEGQRTQAYAERPVWVESSKFHYVAWGDSYSSGEGVEPFESGTENGCHRSVNAYPRVLEEDSSLNLQLGNDFVACSGATTSGITLGDGVNPAQMDTLTADTDLVTMTIGGNNMPFEEFAEACTKPFQGNACTMNGSATGNAMSGIVNDVIPRVEYMLGTVRDRLITLGNTDATVLVVGYPQLVPSTWNYGAPGCGWLQAGETAAIRHVVTQLNTAIKNEVEAIGYNFHFVSATGTISPFIGRELCRTVADTNANPNYFNNVVLGGPDVYTFHPNQEGQAAYAKLVKSWLAANPLVS